MDAREAAMACQWLGLRYAVPCHQDDPSLPEVVQFARFLAAARKDEPEAPEPVVLAPGDTFEVPTASAPTGGGRVGIFTGGHDA